MSNQDIPFQIFHPNVRLLITDVALVLQLELLLYNTPQELAETLGNDVLAALKMQLDSIAAGSLRECTRVLEEMALQKLAQSSQQQQEGGV